MSRTSALLHFVSSVLSSFVILSFLQPFFLKKKNKKERGNCGAYHLPDENVSAEGTGGGSVGVINSPGTYRSTTTDHFFFATVFSNDTARSWRSHGKRNTTFCSFYFKRGTWAKLGGLLRTRRVVLFLNPNSTRKATSFAWFACTAAPNSNRLLVPPHLRPVTVEGERQRVVSGAHVRARLLCSVVGAQGVCLTVNTYSVFDAQQRVFSSAVSLVALFCRKLKPSILIRAREVDLFWFSPASDRGRWKLCFPASLLSDLWNVHYCAAFTKVRSRTAQR